MRGHLIATSALALVLGIGSADAKTPKDQLIVGMHMANLTSLDPHNMNSYETHHILGNIYDTLLRTDPKDPSKLLPRAASSWSAAPDGTLTFILRDDLTSHAGRKLTSEDVVYSLRRAVKLGLLGAGYFKEWGYTATNVDELFSAPDAKTVVMKPVTAIAPNLKLFVLARAVGSILDRQEVEAHAKDGDMGRGWLAAAAAGTGPFKLVRWNANDIVLMDRHDGYWAGAAKMKRVVIRHIPESQTQRLQLEQGDLDVGYQLSSADIDGLEASPNVVIQRIAGAGFYYFIMSAKDPDFAKPAVRSAMRWCVDYEGINAGIMKNYGTLPTNLVPQDVMGAIPPTGQKYDPARCKSELAAAGYPDGLKKVFRSLNSPPYSEIATAMQASMAKGGVTAEVIMGNGDQTYGPMRNRQFEFGLGRSASAVQSDPDGWIRTLIYNPDNSDAAKLSNLLAWRSSFSSPEINKLMDEAAGLTDDAKRAPFYQAAQKLYEQASPTVIAVSQRVDPFALTRRLTGYVGDPTWMVRWDVVEKTD